MVYGASGWGAGVPEGKGAGVCVELLAGSAAVAPGDAERVAALGDGAPVCGAGVDERTAVAAAGDATAVTGAALSLARHPARIKATVKTAPKSGLNSAERIILQG